MKNRVDVYTQDEEAATPNPYADNMEEHEAINQFLSAFKPNWLGYITMKPDGAPVAYSVYETGHPYRGEGGHHTVTVSRYIAQAMSVRDLMQAVSAWRDDVTHPRFGVGEDGLMVTFGSAQFISGAIDGESPDVFKYSDSPVKHVSVDFRS